MIDFSLSLGRYRQLSCPRGSHDIVSSDSLMKLFRVILISIIFSKGQASWFLQSYSAIFSISVQRALLAWFSKCCLTSPSWHGLLITLLGIHGDSTGGSKIYRKCLC